MRSSNEFPARFPPHDERQRNSHAPTWQALVSQGNEGHREDTQRQKAPFSLRGFTPTKMEASLAYRECEESLKTVSKRALSENLNGAR